MWGRGWSLSSVIFFVNRYLAFVDVVLGLAQYFIIPPLKNLQTVCQDMLYARAWLVIFGVNTADCILILRTYAILDNDKRVAAGLFAVLLGSFAVEGVYMMLFVRSFVFTEVPNPVQFPGCNPSFANSTPADTAYLALVAFETIVFVVTLYKLLGRRKNQFGTPSLLLQTLFRDGIVSYAMVFGVSLVNIVVPHAEVNDLGLILVPFHRVLHSVLTSRLVLNIRRAALSPIGLGSRETV